MNHRQQAALALTALVCLLAFLWAVPQVNHVSVTGHTTKTPAILIDPGHGGADGGATGLYGVQEKDVNLSIAHTLAALLRVLGFPVTMTREDDRSIHTPDVLSLREQKVSDMHRRLELYQQADLVLSIHQNHFSQAQYSGAQVFYAPQNAQSQPLAAAVRLQILALLQPENTRELKQADRTLYLMTNTPAPTALVECGFLSNPAECRQLADPAYQRQMAFAITTGVLHYLAS